MNLWLRWVLHLPFILLGWLQSYSSCQECGVTWNAAEPHDIPISDYSSMFPICEHCFETLDGESIYYHCWRLWKQWKKYGEMKNKPDWDEASGEIIKYLYNKNKLKEENDGYHGTV